jgi:hypothetical protein
LLLTTQIELGSSSENSDRSNAGSTGTDGVGDAEAVAGSCVAGGVLAQAVKLSVMSDAASIPLADALARVTRPCRMSTAYAVLPGASEFGRLGWGYGQTQSIPNLASWRHCACNFGSSCSGGSWVRIVVADVWHRE